MEITFWLVSFPLNRLREWHWRFRLLILL